MELELKDNLERKQYEFHIEGKVARLEYIKVPDRIFLTHTEDPQGLEGRGIASTLIERVLQEVKKMNLTLVPLCPFVAGFIKDIPSTEN